MRSSPRPSSGSSGSGLVESAGGLVSPRVRLVPHDDLLIVSDIPDEAEDQPDHVAGIHNPSVTLAHLTIRRPVETALDVGTGSGIQAILAARHSARVVATDLSERALNFATFNALLNGARGSSFAPGASSSRRRASVSASSPVTRRT